MYESLVFQLINEGLVFSFVLFFGLDWKIWSLLWSMEMKIWRLMCFLSFMISFFIFFNYVITRMDFPFYFNLKNTQLSIF